MEAFQHKETSDSETEQSAGNSEKDNENEKKENDLSTSDTSEKVEDNQKTKEANNGTTETNKKENYEIPLEKKSTELNGTHNGLVVSNESKANNGVSLSKSNKQKTTDLDILRQSGVTELPLVLEVPIEIVTVNPETELLPKATSESKKKGSLKVTEVKKQRKINSNLECVENESSIKSVVEFKTKDLEEKSLLKSASDTAISASDILQKSPQTKDGRRKRSALNAPHNLDMSELENDSSPVKKKKLVPLTKDQYCWRCHRQNIDANCSVCPRSWHRRCMGGAPPLSTDLTIWVCPECIAVKEAEDAKAKSTTMSHVTIDQLCIMLQYVIERMKEQTGSGPFLNPVDLDEVPTYLEYVVKPMDISVLESNLSAKMYTSIEVFMADAKWIQHNCIVYNTCGGVYADISKLTNTAKQMLKVARQEVSEIEACPECFSYGRNIPKPIADWFIQPCHRPHPIVWAKLKGFPFWPAKALPRLNAQGLVDVRFFGQHDRAWVSPKDIYLFSEEPPISVPKKKKVEMDECVREVIDHFKKLQVVFGDYQLAPARTPYDPQNQLQIQALLPNYDPVTNTCKSTQTKLSSSSPKKKNATISKVENTVVLPKSVKVSPNSQVQSTIPEITPTASAVNNLEKRTLTRKRKRDELNDPNSANNNESVKNIQNSKVNNKLHSISIDPEINEHIESQNEKTKNFIIAVEKLNKIDQVDVVENNEIPEGASSTTTDNDTGSTRISDSVSVTPIKKTKNQPAKKMKLANNMEKQEISDSANEVNKQIIKPLLVVQSRLPINSDAITITAKNIRKKQQKQLTKKKQINLLPMVNQKGKITNQSSNDKKPISGNPRNNDLLAANYKTKMPSNYKDIVKIPIVQLQSNKNPKELYALNNHLKETNVIAQKCQPEVYNSEYVQKFHEKDVTKQISPHLSPEVSLIKQEPKDEQYKILSTKKGSKARKTFANKPQNFYPNILLNKTSGSPSNLICTPSSKKEAATFNMPPPEAGPLTEQILLGSKNLVSKMAQFILETIKNTGSNSQEETSLHNDANAYYLKLQIEKLKWEHQQEMRDIKQKNDIALRELRSSLEVERFKVVQQLRDEMEKCIKETKRKQWCVVCGQEARFYCCWNTAYCDYPCQQKHWNSHMSACTQKALAKVAATGPIIRTQKVMPKLVINNSRQPSILRRA